MTEISFSRDRQTLASVDLSQITSATHSASSSVQRPDHTHISTREQCSSIQIQTDVSKQIQGGYSESCVMSLGRLLLPLALEFVQRVSSVRCYFSHNDSYQPLSEFTDSAVVRV